jgi:hypothetical protein
METNADKKAVERTAPINACQDVFAGDSKNYIFVSQIKLPNINNETNFTLRTLRRKNKVQMHEKNYLVKAQYHEGHKSQRKIKWKSLPKS